MTIRTSLVIRPTGFSLLELLAAVALVGLLAALALPRITHSHDTGNTASCHMNQAEIELQAFLWFRVNGTWPSAGLADIGANAEYFPEGPPTCPVDGSAYTIDSSGRVVGHTH